MSDSNCIYTKTTLGTIKAKASNDPNYPGIWIFMEREGCDDIAQVALVEVTNEESDLPDKPHLITRVWDDLLSEEYQTRVVHENVNEFFSEQREGDDLGSPLLDFIRQEVPFRLTKIFKIPKEEQSENVIEQLVQRLFNNTDVMFAYDKLDWFLYHNGKALGLNMDRE